MATPSASPSVPVTREALNHRKVDLCGYRRSDGLWDIEATLTDTRTYDSTSLEKGRIAPGEPVHHIHVSVTVDDALVVQSARAAMHSVPYGACPGALPAVGGLAGARIGAGWRRQVEERLGGSQGCTHIRELLAQIATMAYQTVPVWHAQAAGDIVQGKDGKPPQHLGQCKAWAFDGPVVAQHYPQFFQSASS